MTKDTVHRSALLGGMFPRIISISGATGAGGQVFFPEAIYYPDEDPFDNELWSLEYVTTRGEPVYRLEGAGAHG